MGRGDFHLHCIVCCGLCVLRLSLGHSGVKVTGQNRIIAMPRFMITIQHDGFVAGSGADDKVCHDGRAVLANA